MSACKFRSAAPPAYPQEPHVPGQPRHRELGQVRKAKYGLCCGRIPLEYAFALLLVRGILFCCASRSVLSTEIRVVPGGGKTGQEKGLLSRELNFTDVCLLPVAGSAGGFAADDGLISPTPSSRNSFPPGSSSTNARQLCHAPSVTLPTPCQRANTWEHPVTQTLRGIPGKPCPKYFQSMKCLGQSWPYK